MAASHVATLRNAAARGGGCDRAVHGWRSGRGRADWCVVYLLQHGNDVEAMRLLARIGMARKVFDDAELLLAAVLELAPDYRVARVGVRRGAHRAPPVQPGASMSSIGCCWRIPPTARIIRACMPRPRVGLGEHERAIALYRDLLAAAPGDADLHLSIAHALKTLGKRDEAIESYRRAASLPARLRRCLLESCQPQDLPVHGCRDLRD